MFRVVLQIRRDAAVRYTGRLLGCGEARPARGQVRWEIWVGHHKYIDWAALETISARRRVYSVVKS